MLSFPARCFIYTDIPQRPPHLEKTLIYGVLYVYLKASLIFLSQNKCLSIKHPLILDLLELKGGRFTSLCCHRLCVCHWAIHFWLRSWNQVSRYLCKPLSSPPYVSWIVFLYLTVCCQGNFLRCKDHLVIENRQILRCVCTGLNRPKEIFLTDP